jgi:hypothetical protein
MKTVNGSFETDKNFQYLGTTSTDQNCVYDEQRLEVLTAVTMTSTVFWDVTPSSLVKVYRCSEEGIASIFRVEK